MKDYGHFSYIVVGAGAAGCVVANRLSADPNNTVLLLEAGGKDWNPLIHIPIGFTKLTTPDVNWGFSTVPQPQMNDREMWYPQGRTLGGSTSINAMIYIRGHRNDYDTWAQQGNKGWGYQDVLPYFKKSENNDLQKIEVINRKDFYKILLKYFKYEFKSEEKLIKFSNDIFSNMNIMDDNDHYIKVRDEIKYDYILVTTNKSKDEIFNELSKEILY